MEIKVSMPPYKSYKITIETKAGELETKYTKEFANRCYVCQHYDCINAYGCIACTLKYNCNFTLHEKLTEEILSHIPLSVSHLLED